MKETRCSINLGILYQHWTVFIQPLSWFSTVVREQPASLLVFTSISNETIHAVVHNHYENNSEPHLTYYITLKKICWRAHTHTHARTHTHTDRQKKWATQSKVFHHQTLTSYQSNAAKLHIATHSFREPKANTTTIRRGGGGKKWRKGTARNFSAPAMHNEDLRMCIIKFHWIYILKQW